MTISRFFSREEPLQVTFWSFVLRFMDYLLFLCLSVNWGLLRIAFPAVPTPSFLNCKSRTFIISSTSFGYRYNIYVNHFPTCNFKPILSSSKAYLPNRCPTNFSNATCLNWNEVLEMHFLPAFHHIFLSEKGLSNPSPFLYFLCYVLLWFIPPPSSAFIFLLSGRCHLSSIFFFFFGQNKKKIFFPEAQTYYFTFPFKTFYGSPGFKGESPIF